MWSFGYWVNAPVWHHPGLRGLTEVVWSNLKTCAQAAKAFLCCSVASESLFLGIKLDFQNPFCHEYECLTEKLVKAIVSAGGVNSHLELS